MRCKSRPRAGPLSFPTPRWRWDRLDCGVLIAAAAVRTAAQRAAASRCRPDTPGTTGGPRGQPPPKRPPRPPRLLPRSASVALLLVAALRLRLGSHADTAAALRARHERIERRLDAVESACAVVAVVDVHLVERQRCDRAAAACSRPPTRAASRDCFLQRGDPLHAQLLCEMRR